MTLLCATLLAPLMAVVAGCTASQPQATPSAEPREESALTVEVVGRQFWFEFRYPEHGVAAAGELHIPVAEAVTLELTTRDVVHSFWAQTLMERVYLVPNTTRTVVLKADKVGEFPGICADFCGLGHTSMHFRVIVEPRPKFDAWLEAQASDVGEPIEPLAKEGQDLFMSREAACYACHTVRGTQKGRGDRGPDLTHFASRPFFAGSTLENTPAMLRDWLADPNALKPGNIMARDAPVYNDPDLALTETQISALVAYLLSLE